MTGPYSPKLPAAAVRYSTSRPTVAQTHLTKSAHQASGLPAAPLELEPKPVPPLLFVELARLPRFASARATMRSAVVAAACADTCVMSGPVSDLRGPVWCLGRGCFRDAEHTPRPLIHHRSKFRKPSCGCVRR